MAVNKTINKRTNTHGAMRNCIEYGTMDKLLSSPQTDWMKQFSTLSHRESRGEWKWEKL